ncbi:MAG: hypothetical protein RI907_2545 [Pseudomonadota bacterium]|jgi:hypothetical protein
MHTHPLTTARLRIALTGLALSQVGIALAQALPEFKPSPDRGFSYFLGLAQQTAAYSEKPSIFDVKMSSKTRSAMLVSGALYAFNDDLLMSLDNLSTFAPTDSKENWTTSSSTLPVKNTNTGVWEPVATTGPLLQTNRFSLNMSNTRLLAHVRSWKDTFYVGGVSFRSQSFKRYDFRVVQSQIIADQPVPSEESTSEVVAEIGLAMESERVKASPTHYGLKVSVGTPLWRRTTNTSFPGYTFSNRQGWDANVEGRYSWALSPIAHLGVWGKYTFSERSGQVINDGSDKYELPLSHLRTTTVGVELLWKL